MTVRVGPSPDAPPGSVHREINIKSAATRPPLRVQVVDEHGAPEDITGDTLLLHIVAIDGTVLVNGGAMATVVATDGTAEHTLAAPLPAGEHRAEVHRTLAGGGVVVYPDTGYITVRVETALG